MISIRQMKAARALLGWDQSHLAMKSGLHSQTVNQMEKRGLGRSYAANADLVQRTLERAGIRFVSGGAVLADNTDKAPDKVPGNGRACLTTSKGA